MWLGWCVAWVFFFFFKQKTAYEMRISDWSSDVCSSDLLDALAEEGLRRLGALQAQAWLKAGGGRDGFKATGIAYVRFAHDEPALFRLSFTRQMPERKGQEAGDGGQIAYNLLRAGVGEVFPTAQSADAATLHSWELGREG